MPIRLPGRASDDPPVEFESPCRLVIVGANGSGKTRLGIWLEEQNQASMTVHRISAQKALSIPDSVPAMNESDAEKDLLLGRHDQHADIRRKKHDRWGSRPATHLLTDYDKLLALLFARDTARDRQYTAQSRRLGAYAPVPDSPIDVIVRIWTDLMPHRTISFFDGKVLVDRGTDAEYHAQEMSDGERVALYFLGQCLCAPPGSMLIIDEPELHLHRALVDKLWNQVERLCPDKSLVYITHDLNFAANRADASKIWVRSFDGKTWSWSDLPTDEALPESLLLEIIGSRKPLLFCEGQSGGLDHVLYQTCFPHRHVIPRGGAEKVVEAVKAMRDNASLHEFDAVGIVDRDVRSPAEIAALESSGIHVLAFSEVENLICAAELIEEVARNLSQDPAHALAEATRYVDAALRAERETQVGMRAESAIRYQLSRYNPPSRDNEGLKRGINDLVGAIDVAATVLSAQAIIDQAVATGLLNSILGVYNRKSLADRISGVFGLRNGEYPRLVLRLLKGPMGEHYRALVASHLPRL